MIGTLVYLALRILVLLGFTALLLGTACAWLMDQPFAVGWDAVWARWPIAIVWTLVMRMRFELTWTKS